MSDDRLRMLVVADDLTGANDTSVSFASVGYRTVLLMDATTGADFDEVEVVAASTDSRPVGAVAQGLTTMAVSTAMGQGVERLYVKIDSTMRGSVQYQVEGAVRAWRIRYPDAVAVICSAYPAMGRTINDGILQVNGVDVDQTASGKDPVCPVTTPKMGELLPQAAVLTNPGDAAQLAEAIKATGSSQVVVDAATQEDLAVIAGAIDLIGPAAIPVGSAGLSKELTPFLPTPAGNAPVSPLPIKRRPLVVVSSIHETSQAQVDEYIGSAKGANAIVFSPHPAQLLAHASLPFLQGQLRNLVQSGEGTVIIRANPAKVQGAADREQLARGFASQLADLANDCLQRNRFGALVLVGGDGAAATLQAIGANQLTIIRQIAEGVPLGTVGNGEFNGLPIITKSGGFGGPDLLCNIMETLNEGEPQS